VFLPTFEKKLCNSVVFFSLCFFFLSNQPQIDLQLRWGPNSREGYEARGLSLHFCKEWFPVVTHWTLALYYHLVRLNLSVSHLAVFFSRNKSASAPTPATIQRIWCIYFHNLQIGSQIIRLESHLTRRGYAKAYPSFDKGWTNEGESDKQKKGGSERWMDRERVADG
jgi:hypothetical protein